MNVDELFDVNKIWIEFITKAPSKDKYSKKLWLDLKWKVYYDDNNDPFKFLSNEEPIITTINTLSNKLVNVFFLLENITSNDIEVNIVLSYFGNIIPAKFNGIIPAFTKITVKFDIIEPDIIANENINVILTNIIPENSIKLYSSSFIFYTEA